MASPRLLVIASSSVSNRRIWIGAGDLDLVAEQSREIDVEAGGIAVRAGEIERRIVGFGQKPDHREARQIGPVGPPPRVPEAGHRLRRGLHGGFRRTVCACDARHRTAPRPAAAAAITGDGADGFEAVFRR